MGKRKSGLKAKTVTAGMSVEARVSKLLTELGKHVKIGRYTDAIEILQGLISFEPENFTYYNLLGDLHLRCSQFGGAITAFSKALSIEPRHPEVYIGLGQAMHEFRQFEGAAASFEIATLYQPKNHKAFGYWANALIELGKFEHALELLGRAIDLDPADPIHHLSRGQLLTRMGQPEQALGDFERAVTLRPEDASFRLGQAAQWYRIRNYEAALEGVDRLIAAGRADAVTHNFRGAILADLGRHQESLGAYTDALAINPAFHDASFNKALSCLLQGDFEQGWTLYEHRWTRSTAPAQRQFSAPLWLGDSPLTDRVLYVHCEQGLGDVIQFSRNVIAVAGMAKSVIFEVPDVLYSLFQNMPANVMCRRLGERIPEHDLRCPLLSLPLALGIRLETIPAEMAELSVVSSVLSEKIQHFIAKTPLRVGVVWSGNPGHINDHNRSIPFEHFSSIVDEIGTAVCLQKEVRSSDIDAVQQCPGLLVVSESLRDMNDTAAIIRQLDLVISVDTSVAHLAATLGVPTWILLPYSPDFRWLLSRNDSPWYPSVRLFRQEEPKNWLSPLNDIRRQLASLATGRKMAMEAVNVPKNRLNKTVAEHSLRERG